MITQEHLDNRLLKCIPENYEGNFVAAAVLINTEGVAKHAGLLVSCGEGVFLCHFDATDILIEEPPEGWYFYKIFEFIDSRLSSAFLGLCKNIKDTSNPRYGAYYEGSFFNQDGTYYSETVKQEYMTCVGFCINVIKGFLSDEDEVEFFNYTDWTNADLPEAYLNEFVIRLQAINANITIDNLKENVRRIKPVEFLAAAYLSTLPIYRADINRFLAALSSILATRILPNPIINN